MVIGAMDSKEQLLSVKITYNHILEYFGILVIHVYICSVLIIQSNGKPVFIDRKK